MANTHVAPKRNLLPEFLKRKPLNRDKSPTSTRVSTLHQYKASLNIQSHSSLPIPCGRNHEKNHWNSIHYQAVYPNCNTYSSGYLNYN